jgi:Tol biopolymer transport system component
MKNKIRVSAFLVAVLAAACAPASPAPGKWPGEYRWGIYAMDLDGREATLLYGAETTISNIRLNHAGDALAFSMNIGEESLNGGEIFTLDLRSRRLERLTDNGFLDAYPVWSPDDGRIAYLSWPDATLDIYVMEKTGGGHRLLYDSGFHDGDIDWAGDTIAFTRNSRIWIMDSDGTNARAVTDPPRAGETGKANLPFGDYDPRISPDGKTVLFERMERDDSPHGNYDFYIANLDGSGIARITQTGYTQGLANWSPSGAEFLFIVTAINGEGKYDLHVRNRDGSGDRNLTPDYFPDDVLIHEAVFSRGATAVYFIAERWE